MATAMTVARTVAERRHQRAEVLASQFASWIPCTTKFAGRTQGGSVVFAIPSQTVLGKFHLATADRCGCHDSTRRSGRCKHQLAIRIVLQQFGLRPATQPVVRPSWADVIIEEEIAA